MEPLSNMTLADVKLAIPLEDKTASEALTIYNRAQQLIADFINLRTDRTDYYESADGDADLVLAPTASSTSNMYDGYLHIKFSAYTGDYSAVSNVSASKVDFSNLTPADDVAVSIDGTLVTYVISLTGATVDGNTILQISDPEAANVTRSGTDEITVVTSTSHGAFSIFLKNAKES